MGADLILYDVPACGIDDDRRKVLTDLIAASTLHDTPGEYDDLEEYQADMTGAVAAYECFNQRRDTALIRMEGAPYSSWLTGGMSWGDDPTEIAPKFSRLVDHAPIMDQLRRWAIEDAKT